MKSIIAFSDTHHREIPEKLKNVMDENDYLFFLGDGAKSLDELIFHPGFHGVRGNTDDSHLPEEEVFEIENVRVLLTHGDTYGVKQSLQPLAQRANELNCSVVFYGHTHFAEICRFENITFICPGAVSDPVVGSPTYAYANISNGKIVAKIVKLV